MDAKTRHRFIYAAIMLGGTPRQAEILAQCADGKSHKKVAYDTGLTRPYSVLSRLYDTLKANHRGHAIAIVFEKMLEGPPMGD